MKNKTSLMKLTAPIFVNALIMTTSGVGGISGSIGGGTYAKGRGGLAWRQKAIPLQPRTSAVMGVRAIFASITQAWRGLTLSEISAWNSLADQTPYTNIFGQTAKLSGKALFQRYNQNLLLYGGVLTTDATIVAAEINDNPIGFVGDYSPSFAQTGQAATIGFSNSPVPANNVLVIESTGVVSNGISNANNLYRGLTTAPAAAASPYDIAAAYTARWGTLTQGQKIFTRAWLVNTISGQSGIAMSAASIVAA